VNHLDFNLKYFSGRPTGKNFVNIKRLQKGSEHENGEIQKSECISCNRCFSL